MCSHDQLESSADELLQAGQRRVLELVAKDAPLTESLGVLCRLIEEQEDGMLCSLLLPDRQRRQTGLAVGGSLPDVFLRGIEGLSLEPPYIGACGETLMEGATTTVPDINGDERYCAEWRALMAHHGIRSTKSLPVAGKDGEVLASLAFHRRDTDDPSPRNTQLVEIATSLAAIAIERQHSKERLQASEEQFRALFNSMDEGYCVAEVSFDAHGRADYRIVEMNPAFEKHTGQRNMLGRSVRETLPGLEEAWFEIYGGVARTGEATRFVHQASPMERRWFDVYAFRLGGAGSSRIGILFTDISERHGAEERLRLSEERFRLMVESARDFAIFTLDRDGCVTGWNSGAQNLLGYEEPEIMGRSGEILFTPEDRARRAPQREFETARRDGRAENERWHVRKDGSRFWGSGLAMPMWQDGKHVGFVKMMRDRTEARLAEEKLRQQAEQLREADQRKDEFLATLAHELRNPLAPVRNAAHLLHLNSAPREVAWARDVIDRQMQQMTRLIDDLLDVSRISRGEMELKRERITLASVIDSAVETSRPLITHGGQHFDVTLPTTPVLLDGDPTRLSQIVSNLLNNAAKFTVRGGRIWLTAQVHDHTLQISVRDSGIGIPADKMSSIFELFSQVRNTSDRSQGGLGIGLSLVKRLIGMHGGTIEAFSNGPGTGSEFVMRAPIVVEDAGGSHARSDEQRVHSSTLRILIVDDNRDAADSLAMMLSALGHDVGTVYDGEQAVHAAERVRPQVVLMDIGLPRLNGYEACRRIREQPWGAAMVLIAVTGWGQEADTRQAAEAGFDRHLVKPVDPRQLIATLDTIREQTAG